MHLITSAIFKGCINCLMVWFYFRAIVVYFSAGLIISVLNLVFVICALLLSQIWIFVLKDLLCYSVLIWRWIKIIKVSTDYFLFNLFLGVVNIFEIKLRWFNLSSDYFQFFTTKYFSRMESPGFVSNECRKLYFL